MTRLAALPANPKIITDADAPREDWLAARRGFVGASEVAAVMGANTYSTPLDVFREKCDGWERNLFNGNNATRAGHMVEDAVLRRTAEDTSLTLRPGQQLLHNPAYPHLAATCDGFLTRPRSWTTVALAEAKTTAYPEEWVDGRHPFTYHLQVQAQLMVTGVEVCYLGCLVFDTEREFHLREIHADHELQAEIAAAVDRFWVEHVETGVPPFVDIHHPKTEEALRATYPTVVSSPVELDTDVMEWVHEFVAAKAAVKTAEERLRAAKNAVLMFLGDAGAGYLGERRVLYYPEIRQRRVDLERLREKHPDVAVEVTVESSYRRLTVNPPPAP